MLKMNGLETSALSYEPDRGLVVSLKGIPDAATVKALEDDLRQALRDSPFTMLTGRPLKDEDCGRAHA